MAENAPSIVIVAGEASGDLQGAYLAARLRQALPSVRIRGVGGRKMHNAGVELIYDSSAWSAIGIAEAIKLVPRLLLILRNLKAKLKADPPDVVVLIDFGAFNVRIGKFLHSMGVKVLYYFPPSSWNRNAHCERLKEVTDRVVTPFPWSADLLKKHGFRADFFGHPLLDIVKPTMSRDEFCEQFGFDASSPIIGLLPGSRTQEIVHNMPALVIAAARMLNKIPNLQFAVPPAPSVNPFRLADELGKVAWVQVEAHNTMAELPVGSSRISSQSLANQVRSLTSSDGFKAPGSPVRIKLLPGMIHDVLAHSQAAVVTSGTATVEAAILDCPMVIIYRGSWLTALEYKLRGGKLKYIGMPNIILDRPICPELVADAATPRRIADLMLGLIPDSPARTEMLDALAEVREILGSPGAIEKTVQVVLDMLNESA